MNHENTHELLDRFFGAYFHQDWSIEADSPEAVVDRYITDTRTLGDKHILALAIAIRDYAARFTTDLELEDRLFRDFDCNYGPSLDNRSAKEWMASVAKQLLDSRGLTIDDPKQQP
jgi:hypothetical protein